MKLLIHICTQMYIIYTLQTMHICMTERVEPPVGQVVAPLTGSSEKNFNDIIIPIIL